MGLIIHTHTHTGKLCATSQTANARCRAYLDWSDLGSIEICTGQANIPQALKSQSNRLSQKMPKIGVQYFHRTTCCRQQTWNWSPSQTATLPGGCLRVSLHDSYSHTLPPPATFPDGSMKINGVADVHWLDCIENISLPLFLSLYHTASLLRLWDRLLYFKHCKTLFYLVAAPTELRIHLTMLWKIWMVLENICNYIKNAEELNFSKVRLRICNVSC